MAKIEKGPEAAQPAGRKPLQVIAKLWPAKGSKFEFFAGPVGSIRKGVQEFTEITLKANSLGLRDGDRVAIMPNKGREGKNDAAFQLVLMQD